MKKKYFKYSLRLAGLSALLIVAAVSGACDKQKKDKEQADAESKAPTAINAIEIETGTLVDRLGYTGDIEGQAEIRVYSPIPDRIVSLKAKEGDRVKQGDTLAVIRSSALTEGVNQAAGGLDAVRAQRVALQDQVERLQKLKNSGAVTSSQLLTVESQLAGAEAQVRQLEAMLGQARQRKGDAVVRAPINGVIGQVFVEVGDMAVPQVPICTVVDMDKVRIKVRVPESDLAKLMPGQPATYEVTNGASRQGVVSRVSPVLDRLSRTATVEIDVDNPDHSLKPGMLARIQVEVEKRENAIWAPKNAMTVTPERRGNAQVFRAVVVENGKASERKVLLGLEDGERVEVLEGLKQGERLVVEGQHLLENGDPVRMAAAASPENKTPQNPALTEIQKTAADTSGQGKGSI